MSFKNIHTFVLFVLLCFIGRSQDVAYNEANENAYSKAQVLAYAGNHTSAKDILIQTLSDNPDHIESRTLLARTYTWSGQYAKARNEFNNVTSKDKTNKPIWIAAIKNELYAKQNATALGLANKALFYLKNDYEVERLKAIAMQRLNNEAYPELGWHNTKSTLNKSEPEENEKISEVKPVAEIETENEEPKNRIAIRNAFTVFDQRYDPIVYSSISLRRQTLAGSIIPRINFSNRNGQNGVQYDLDFYPKFSKRFYAYLNYGYSNATIYPNHKMGGDLYVNLPGAFEFSAGGRHIVFSTRDISVITNSVGHYRGNYYFSLRSYITPKSDNLTSFSGNLLIRRYLKDAENYLGINVGMGFSPEIQQLISGDELLAETLLYVQSQRLSVEYQFTGKNNSNSYRANMSLARQELSFESGSFFWGITAGLTYQVDF